jgi:hypothetical protein
MQEATSSRVHRRASCWGKERSGYIRICIRGVRHHVWVKKDESCGWGRVHRCRTSVFRVGHYAAVLRLACPSTVLGATTGVGPHAVVVVFGFRLLVLRWCGRELRRRRRRLHHRLVHGRRSLDAHLRSLTTTCGRKGSGQSREPSGLAGVRHGEMFLLGSPVVIPGGKRESATCHRGSLQQA